VRQETRSLLQRIAIVASIVFTASLLLVALAPLIETGRVESGVLP
jgi:hypothetical protein